jgi:DNA (cytosine-5)-methyltransferase 1
MLQLAKGQALSVIVGELERLGYSWCHRVVDALAFGRPQRRERVFLVASKDHDPREVLFGDDYPPPAHEQKAVEPGRAYGFYWTEGVRGLGWAVEAVPTLKGGSTVGIASPPAILLPDGHIVKPDIRDAERLQGFEPDWTTPALGKARPGHRWKLVGNAVNVDVARWIGQRLAEPSEWMVPQHWRLRAGERWPSAAWNVGDGRFGSDLGSWPVRVERPPLAEFLEHPVQPLSERATRGFRERTRRASLSFPRGFLEAVDRHLQHIAR